jgi:hypothetical protein
VVGVALHRRTEVIFPFFPLMLTKPNFTCYTFIKRSADVLLSATADTTEGVAEGSPPPNVPASYAAQVLRFASDQVASLQERTSCRDRNGRWA